MVRQDKSKPGRTTQKGTKSTPASNTPITGGSGVSREPVKIDGPSPAYVPILMFASLVLGSGVILFNYLTENILGTPNNLYLFGGLGLVLVGIVTATQFR